ncbi:MAG: hypothetical protein MJ191_00255 [Clostridium sp.]|nr:hypothetical protein [Clostridium sp.]
MINVTIGTNTSRKRVIVEENKTLREILAENEVNTAVGTVHVDGIPVSVSEMGQTLAELNISDGAYIIAVAKADNA